MYGLAADLSTPPAISWRNGTGLDPDAYVAVNCPTGTTCYINGGSPLVITSNIATPTARRVMALDSAQHFLQVFGDEMTDAVDLVYPCEDMATACTESNSPSRDMIEIMDTDFLSSVTTGGIPTHELGHCLQKQEFGQDDLIDDCSLNGAGHTVISVEHESCATTEGWGDFVAAASWWDVADSGSRPHIVGMNFEDALPTDTATCAGNKGIEQQAARGFWDLADVNNEAAVSPSVDNDTYSETDVLFIAAGWDQFPNGTSNRDDFEGNGSDADGVNLRDYRFNNSALFGSGAFSTLVYHNCLTAQDDM